MNTPQRYQILLTNDDGIQSPGLWAAAEALSTLGYVTVAAPREQSSGAGRSIPLSSDGKIEKRILTIGSQDWPVYAIGGTPTQVVIHAVLEVLPQKPDLIVSGINYGENVSCDITSSGTVGAAMEGAALGVPSMAVSLHLPNVTEDFTSYSSHFNFPAAAHFTALFAEMLLQHSLPEGVDFLNINIPHDATPQTQWAFTRLSRQRYFNPYVEPRRSPDESAYINAHVAPVRETLEPDSDTYQLIFERRVSVTPMTLDMTAPVDLKALRAKFS